MLVWLGSVAVHKNYAYVKHKSYFSLSNYRAYSLIRAHYKYLSKKYYYSFISRFAAVISSYLYYFWYFIRNLHSSSVSAHVVLDSIASSDPYSFANLFVKYFLTVFTQIHQTQFNPLYTQFSLSTIFFVMYLSCK